MMKYRYKRLEAVGLIAAILCTNAGSLKTVYGAEASVDTDETVYVNLDYYGNIDKVNVVKGCNLNGAKEFTDYGTYLNVENMSGYETPVLDKDTVTWKLPEYQSERFYYKCNMDKEQIVLPWDFDVSYKLNGMPIDADQLAGASGIVEVHIDAQPNDRALEYYRNNMILAVTVTVDYADCYSIEADGAQVQNLGDMTAVAFTALPGEEGDYTVRIGSDSFENIGIIMMMTPGTVEDLEHIADLKDAKDTWQTSVDEMYDSMDQMAASVEAMREGVNLALEGLDAANNARETWSGSKDSILAGNDQALSSLTAVSQQMEVMIPHIQTAKEAADVVHSSMNDIVNTMGEMQDPLRKLNTRLRNIKSDTSSISEQIPELTALMQQLITLDAQLQASEQAYITGLGSMENSFDLIEEDYYWEDEKREEEETEGSNADESEGITGDVQESENQQEMENGTGDEQQNESVTGEVQEEDQEGTDETEQSQENFGPGEASESEGQSDENVQTAQPVISLSAHNVPLTASPIPGVTLDSDELMTLLMLRKGDLEKIAEISSRLSSNMSSLMDETSDAAKYSAEIIDSIDYLIEDLTALDDSLNTYYSDFQASLDDTTELVSRTTNAMNDGISTMTVIQNTLRNSSENFDVAARDSIKASMELMDKSLSILDSTTSMRHAGKTMKDTMDEEWDELDKENRFLFMDPTEDKVSFTSNKNEAPHTLQIVLRTNEISLDDVNDISDAETEKADVSPFERMWNVLVQIWAAIADVFKNR